MKALTISAHGGLDQVTYRDDLPEPEVGRPGDVRIRLRAAALNHLDLFVVGGIPGVSITAPWVLGADGMGTVDAVGSGVGDVAVGDRVVINPGISCRECAYCAAGEHPLCPKFRLLGEHRAGTFAEYIVVPAANVRRIPDEVGDDVAAAFSLATITAWRMLVSRAKVRAGDTVLIQGIGGGVAIAALQIAKALGATVWVTSRSDEKLARAAVLGADGTINSTTVDVAKAMRAHTAKRGADVVVDSVGVATWEQSLLSLGRFGRLVTCGATSGPIVSTDVRRLFWNQWSIMGSTMGSDAEFDAIVAELWAGRLKPPVDASFALADGRAAFERLAAEAQFGKIVLRIA